MASTETRGQVDGVVYKARNMDFLFSSSHLTVMQVSDTRVIVAVDQADSSLDDLDLPERCRVVKLANSITYDRWALLKLICQSSSTVQNGRCYEPAGEKNKWAGMSIFANIADKNLTS